ncbi:MAG: TatD family hydrolase [Saprospiraceae bacterium]|nr:TatD family hydrolase [Saprospiraceae bacterium]
MFIDTHAHLYATKFDNDRAEMLKRADTEGVKKIFLPAIDSETHAAMLALEATDPTRYCAMMGVHPCSIGADFEQELAAAKTYLDQRPFCAIGEIGMDLYWDKTFLEQQKTAFIRQMHWAQDLGIPIIIHSREAMDEIIQILEENAWFTEGGILHCFTGNVEQAQRLIARGFSLGIGGVATYKNGGLEPVIEAIDLKYLVLETDAPYLAPVPYRGKRNESSYLKYIAQKIAEVKKIDLKEVAKQTTENAERIFSKRSKPV